MRLLLLLLNEPLSEDENAFTVELSQMVDPAALDADWIADEAAPRCC